MKRKLYGAAVLGIVSVIAGLLCGCGAKSPAGDGTSDYVTDAELLGIYYHHHSMEREPYYVIGKVGESYYFKTALEDPMYNADGDIAADCFAAADRVSDSETDTSCLLSEESAAQLRETVSQYPVLSWNGYNKVRKSMFAVCDGDDGFTFRMQLADGTSVTASGVGEYPKLFGEFIGKILEICFDNRASQKDMAGCGFTGLYYHHEGTMREPYYVIVRTDSGYCLKVCYEDPHYDEDYNYSENIYEIPEQLPEDSFDEYYYLTEEEAARLEKAVSEHPVRAWDGFCGDDTHSADVLDGGDRYDFELVLEDETVIKASGSYSYPEQFDDFILIVLDICGGR